MAAIDFSGLPDSAVPIFAEMMRERVEANIVRTDNMRPGELRLYIETDENTGSKIRCWVGPESFVKSMGRPCRQVHSFLTDRGQWTPRGGFR
jgi:hypothetical protein